MEVDLLDRYAELMRVINECPLGRVCRVCRREIDQPIKGVGNMCRDCYREREKIRARAYYYKHPELIRARAKEKYRKEKNKASVRAKSNYLFPVPQLCIVEDCGEMGIRHHPDENDPTRIAWLCPQHHKQWHLGRLPIERIGKW